MTDPLENAPLDVPGLNVPDSNALPIGPTTPSAAPEQDALQVLLQASAAAEALQQRFTELQNRQAELVAERNQLAADRSAFEQRAQGFAEQVARDRTTQREAHAELEAKQQQAKQTQLDLDQQRTLLDDDRNDLDSRRRRLQETIDEELARGHENLHRQQHALEKARELSEERTVELEQQHVVRMQEVESTLQKERNTMRESIRKELSVELEQLHRERLEWDTQKENQLHEIQQQSEDLQQQRELFGEQLEHEQQRLKDEIEKRRRMLLSEQNNLQRRYRFQFEHLARSREDFEIDARDLKREQQEFRCERRDFSEQHRLRFGQLQRLREILMQRDASMKREQKVIDRNRISVELDLNRQRQRVQEHQNSVMQDLESRNRRLHQAEQASAEAAKRVEQRLQHVNQLRTELDAKQHDILEQRLLLEELHVNAGQTASQPTNSPGYLQAKRSVESFFEQLHQHLRGERDQLEQKAIQLTERQDQFRQDREELQQWFAGREAELASAEPPPVDSTLQSRNEALEAELAEVRQQWQAERKDSEVAMRELLDQIAAAESRAFLTPVKSEPLDSDGHQSDDDQQRAA